MPISLAVFLYVGAFEAAAQEVPDTSGNVQTLHRSIDAQQTLWTDDAGRRASGTFTARTLLSWTHRPLLWQPNDDADVEAVVGSTWQLDLIGAAHLGPLRIGVDVPVLLGGASDVFSGGAAGVGDVVADGKLTVVDPASSGIGLAVTTRIGLPTASVDVPLGGEGLSWEVAGVVDYQSDAVRLAANVGTRGGPPITLGDAEVGDQLLLRAGVGIPVSDRAGVSADFAARAAYGTEASLGAPVEAIVGGWAQFGDPWTLRAGVGRGFTSAVGSPGARLLVSLAFEPRSDPDPAIEVAETTSTPPASTSGATVESSGDTDGDGDGVVDAFDECPAEPEDGDGYRDDDGCPEDVQLAVHIQDPTGATVQGAFTFLRCGDFETRLSANAVVEVKPGRCEVSVAAPGWTFASDTLVITDGPPDDRAIVLQPTEPFGHLRVKVVNRDGKPVPQAGWSLGNDPTLLPISGGEGSVAVKPGEWTVQVRGRGLAPEQRTVFVEAGEEEVIRITLKPER